MGAQYGGVCATTWKWRENDSWHNLQCPFPSLKTLTTQFCDFAFIFLSVLMYQGDE